MPGMNPLAILVGALASFVASSIWYIVFGGAMKQFSAAAADMARAPAWKKGAEFLRCLVVATVLSHFSAVCGVTDVVRALQFTAWAWIGFPAIILSGSVLWENVPWQLAAIHVGDWLVKILVVTAMVTAIR